MLHFALDTLPSRTSVSGLPIKIISDEHITMTIVELPAGFANEARHQPNEQLGYMLAGEVTYEVDGEMISCRCGDAYLIPANVLHAIHVPPDSPARLMHIYSPPRAEYRQQSWVRVHEQKVEELCVF